MAGTAKTYVPEKKDLNMPAGINWVSKGTTGLRFAAVKSHPPDEVFAWIMPKIKSYPTYKPEIWDCEDHAILAAADIRTNFPGQPVGIAIGKATEGSIAGQDHAVNYIWYESEGGKRWDYKILDPAAEKWAGSFNPEVIIPLPVSGRKDNKELPPFDNPTAFPFREKAAFQLDLRADKFVPPGGDVEKTISNKDFPQRPWPTNPNYKDDATKSEFWTTYDDVFYVFAQIRKKHMGAAVGVAFGDLTKQKKDYAALVLWRSNTEFVYWSPQLGREIPKADFDPRIVIA